MSKLKMILGLIIALAYIYRQTISTFISIILCMAVSAGIMGMLYLVVKD